MIDQFKKAMRDSGALDVPLAKRREDEKWDVIIALTLLEVIERLEVLEAREA